MDKWLKTFLERVRKELYNNGIRVWKETIERDHRPYEATIQRCIFCMHQTTNYQGPLVHASDCLLVEIDVVLSGGKV